MAGLALPMAAQSGLKCTTKELPAHPFMAGEVSRTITALSGYKSFDRERKFSGRARVEIALENKGSSFRRFDPQDLSFIGKDGAQVFPVFERNLADDTPPMSLGLAPGAHASVEYA
jgi:hypothetical protein